MPNLTKSLQSRPIFYFSRWRPPTSWILKFQIFNSRNGQGRRTATSCQILSKSLEPRPRYASFNIMWVWLENAYSHPFGGEGIGAHFPQMMSLIVLTPKRTVLRLNHVIWAIKREYRSRGSSWALERGKKTGQEKSHKGLYFTYLWSRPHWSDVHENLFSKWCSRRNQVRQVSKWNFQGLRNFEFSIFLLIFEWALQQCSSTALPVIS